MQDCELHIFTGRTGHRKQRGKAAKNDTKCRQNHFVCSSIADGDGLPPDAQQLAKMGKRPTRDVGCLCLFSC